MPNLLPTVAIIGRPNVGKSTLFNRLIGERRAITSEQAGTTRDRVKGTVDWNSRSFRLMDTGGLELSPTMKDGADESAQFIDPQVYAQAKDSIGLADIILFLIDGTVAITAEDRAIADLLRRSKKTVMLVVNKMEGKIDDALVAEYYGLGLGTPLPVSASVGQGTGDLLDLIVDVLPRGADKESDDDVIRIAIVGRPNVGKSSLLNSIVGSYASIVSPVPGTTRDPVDMDLLVGDKQVTLIDTAGIRRPGRTKTDLEFYSVRRAEQALERADIAVLVIDVTQKIAKQDQAISSAAQEAKTGIILVANKWDEVEKDQKSGDDVLRALEREFDYLPWTPVVFTSALNGSNVSKILEIALKIDEERRKVVDADDLSKFIHRLTMATPPPSRQKVPIRISAVKQVGVRPPKFLFTTSDGPAIHFSYRRFLARQLRERYGFEGTPLSLAFETKKPD